MKRTHIPLDGDDGRPCPLRARADSDVFVCDMCCGMSKQRNKFLWIVKIPWVMPRETSRVGEPPWVSVHREPAGGFGWRLVHRADLSPDFVARRAESTKYVCFLCAGTFVHGDRNHFKRNRSNGHWVWDGTVDNFIGHRFIGFPCCVDANHSWKNHEQQSVVHSVPNLKENTEWKNPLCLCPECDIV